MSVSFNGISQDAVTFKYTGTVKAGQPVKMSANGTVAACASGDLFAGVAISTASDGYAGVVTGGFVTVGYTGTAPSVGWAYLCADGDGGVKGATSATGNRYLCVEVDTTAATVTFKM